MTHDNPSTEIQLTDDESPTLYRPDIDEHYHSTHGALAESLHVYIKNALLAHPDYNVAVMEVGFGTGLNTLMTLAMNAKNVFYTSFELYPIDPETAISLHYDKLIAGSQMPAEEVQRCWEKIHTSVWDTPVSITPTFTLLKRRCDITHFVPAPDSIDVVYFDAFAPEKQPEIWSPTLFTNIFNAMRHGGILTTYCAKGVIRRLLAATGFTVERLPGPPHGKREILRARKP